MAAKNQPKQNFISSIRCKMLLTPLQGSWVLCYELLTKFNLTQMSNFTFRKKSPLRMLSVRAFKLLKSLFQRRFLLYPLLCWATHRMSTVIVGGSIGSRMLLKLSKSKRDAKDFWELGKEYKMEDPINEMKENFRRETYTSLWSA